ncbi:MAG: hypothetical protein EHM21_17705 [Chloroflexi bacterium]|nr:MAG: hypothetical protein EHM21_17705 [Chloroflexota bacterium]
MKYQIQIKGKLDEDWSDWLGEVNITTTPDPRDGCTTTILAAVEDPPALFGILDRIRDLNLAVMAVTLVEA